MVSNNRETVLLCTDTMDRELTVSYLNEYNYSLFSTDNFDTAISFSKKKIIDILIISSEISSFNEYIKKSRTLNPKQQVLLIHNESNLSSITEPLMNDVDEFLKSPVNLAELKLSLKRVNKNLQFQDKIAQLTKKNPLDNDSIIFNEKLSTLNQIIAGMSEYIGAISKHVQGGVKYFNELPYCISIHNDKHKILLTNDSFTKHLGSKTGNSSWEIYDEEFHSQNNCPVGQTIKTKEIFSGKCIVKYKSGAKIPVFVHTAPILNTKGEIDFILEVFAGTQEIDKMSSDINTTQQDYHQLFNAVPSYITVLNRNKFITESNSSFKKDFGTQTGRAFFDVLKPGSIPVGTDPISKTMLNASPHQGEMVLTSENGTQYNMMTWAAPISTPTGKLIQVLVVFADKTEMRNLKDNLSSLGLMLGTLSHNLKGSLTGLDAGLYLIDTGFYRDKPARIEEGLDVSKLMVDRIRKMIFNVLYYTKERGLNLSTVNIHEFAADVAAHVENRILGGNISFICDFPKADIFCNIDPELLRSALINILENAREVCISDQTDKLFEIKFKVFIEKNDLILQVFDNGIGMDEEQKNQLFSIFSSSKGLKGTGLGLYITNEVIRKHNGQIAVDSATGKGTCFTIKIPQNFKDTTK